MEFCGGVKSPRGIRDVGVDGLGEQVALCSCISRMEPGTRKAQAGDPSLKIKNVENHIWKSSLPAKVVMHSQKSPAESVRLINPLIAESFLLLVKYQHFTG